MDRIEKARDLGYDVTPLEREVRDKRDETIRVEVYAHSVTREGDSTQIANGDNEAWDRLLDAHEAS